MRIWFISLCAFSFYAKANNCVDCHKKETSLWQTSHHAHAMKPASPESVLANFTQSSAEHFSQKAVFFTKANRFFAKVWNDNSKPNVYEVVYTFGFYPLQQYLVKTEKGKMQVLPFAWDTQPKEKGGQRWMHLYQEDIAIKDRLHWQQPLQNWNGMCADCHSDDLTRNYSPVDDTFATHWSNDSVSCASCHDGLPENHYQNKATVQTTTTSTGKWVRPEAARTAFWEGEQRDNSFMDGCFACHGLRSPLTDGFSSDEPFLDQFLPVLPNAPIYQVDGQLKEEAYIFGSFLQSKMHQMGVNCIDCHNAHSYELKHEGNAVCTQCHAQKVFDTPLHHGHKNNTQGAECKNCHMPTTTYMNVDARHDHSFKIPRPDISQHYQTSNACQSCHENKSSAWAANEIKKIQSNDGLASTQPLTQAQRLLLDLQSGKPISYDDHKRILNDKTISAIQRAGALALLAYTPHGIAYDDAQPFIKHENGLFRLAVIAALRNHSHAVKAKLIAPLLKDSLRAVRVEAANELVGVNLDKAYQLAFLNALKEWHTANEQMQFRGESHVNKALLNQKQNDMQAAEKSYLTAIERDPYFDAPYINLTDLYRAAGQPQKAAAIYEKGLTAIPQSAAVNYSYGLHLIRQKQLATSLGFLKKALSLDASNSDYAYLYYLALHTHGNDQAAFCGLFDYINRVQDEPRLGQLLMSIQSKSRHRFDCEK